MNYPLHSAFYFFSQDKPKFVLPVGRDEANWMMFAVEEGSFRFAVNLIEGVIGPGEVLLCPPGCDLHREVIAPLTIHYLGFAPAPTDEEEGYELLEWIKETSSYRISVEDKGRYYSTLQRLKQTFDKQDRFSQQQNIHYINDLWMLLSQEFALRLQRAKPLPDASMLSARQWLEQQAMRPLLLQELSLHLNMTRVALTRKFRAAFGMTPKDYLTLLRMARAKSLLANTDYTIDHIAALCGYENGYYFSRIFNKHTHLRPSVFRKKFSI
ncbi:AraC family transcriptional regulator [Paenibacillaceae bacterium]|nr:AraC family transcriptional regulator [Paenibacillaceae bacterium]